MNLIENFIDCVKLLLFIFYHLQPKTQITRSPTLPYNNMLHLSLMAFSNFYYCVSEASTESREDETHRPYFIYRDCWNH